MYIVYLCGGEGARLRPLTYTVPKPMLPIGSKPVLEISIQRARKQGFKDVILLVNYKAEIIQSYFGDGSSLDVDIQYFSESEPRGTAGPLTSIREIVDDSFIVINADILTEMDFRKLLKFHRINNIDLAVALKEIDIPVPFGIVSLDEKDRIRDIQEKPQLDLLINSGIYSMSPEIIEMIPNDGMYSMTQLIMDSMHQNKRVSGYRFNDYWKDIGRIDDYLSAIQDNKKVDTPDWLKDLW